MKEFTRRHILSIDGGGEGGGTATAAPPAPAPAGSVAPPAPSAPGAFDWKNAGFDDAAINFINTKGWKSPVDQHQSYVNLEKLTGAGPDKLIKLPTNDDPAAWNDVYGKLGRPADANGYKLPVPEGDKGEFAKTASSWFHEAGLSQAQAAKVAEKFNLHNAETMKAEQLKADTAAAADVKALEAAWGANYQANTALVERAAQTFGMTDQHLLALKATLGPKAAMEFLHKIGSKIGVDDQFVTSSTPPSLNGMSAEQAIAKLTAMKTDTAFIEQFNSADPKVRADARALSQRLHQLAYPS
jgi:hypothetical protein